jgi:hypothetical protein
MSEIPSHNNSTVGTHVRIGLLKEGSHFVLLPMHDDLLKLIGLIALHWGAFERQMDGLIQAGLLAANRSVAGWERIKFQEAKGIAG